MPQNTSLISDIILRAAVHKFIGRMGRDPEVRYFESGNCVANTSIAVDPPNKKKNDGQDPDWISLEAWGDSAQELATYKKGDMVIVEGRFRTDQWTDRSTGEEKTKYVLRIVSIEYQKSSIERQPTTNSGDAPKPQVKPVAWGSNQQNNNNNDDDDIPF